MDLSRAALILAAHGSTLNEDSSAPAFVHADAIRSKGIFAEVHEAFWKEEPHFRNVLRQVEVEEIYIVPLFISHGYFTENILPREFGLTGKLTQRDGKRIVYCDPVGVHPDMTKLLLRRAYDVLQGEKIDLKQTALFIVGHGTQLNENSAAIIQAQAQKIRELNKYGDCEAAFMEQEPLIANWHQATDLANIIVVPFFISDGLHSYEDIPVLLGISENVRLKSFRNPTLLHHRKLWYTQAIGTEPLLTDVILAQVEAARKN